MVTEHTHARHEQENDGPFRAKHAAETRRPLHDRSNAVGKHTAGTGGVGSGHDRSRDFDNAPVLRPIEEEDSKRRHASHSFAHFVHMDTSDAPTSRRPSAAEIHRSQAGPHNDDDDNAPLPMPGVPGSHGAANTAGDSVQMEDVPPSPNMAKRPRSVSMEVISANDRKTRPSAKSGPGYTLVGADVGTTTGREFIQRMAQREFAQPPADVMYLEDELDPQMCEEYSGDIYAYMYRIQEQFMVDPSYIDAMPAELRWPRNRRTLLNWLLTVHRKFHLVAETLFLAVNVIDRFLSASLRHARRSSDVLPLDQVQLLAATALFVAAKYEEVMTPAISNFSYVANASDEDIRSMEKRVLIATQFDLGAPCPLNFLRRISKADDYDMNTRTVAKFLLEIQLFEPRLMTFRPSDVAAAAMLGAQQILSYFHWRQSHNTTDGAVHGQGHGLSNGHSHGPFASSSQGKPARQPLQTLPQPDDRLSLVLSTMPVAEPAPWSAAFTYFSEGSDDVALRPIVAEFARYLLGPCQTQDPEFIKKYTSRKVMAAAVLAMEWARQVGPESESESDDEFHEA